MDEPSDAETIEIEIELMESESLVTSNVLEQQSDQESADELSQTSQTSSQLNDNAPPESQAQDITSKVVEVVEPSSEKQPDQCEPVAYIEPKQSNDQAQTTDQDSDKQPTNSVGTLDLGEQRSDEHQIPEEETPTNPSSLPQLEDDLSNDAQEPEVVAAEQAEPRDQIAPTDSAEPIEQKETNETETCLPTDRIDDQHGLSEPQQTSNLESPDDTAQRRLSEYPDELSQPDQLSISYIGPIEQISLSLDQDEHREICEILIEDQNEQFDLEISAGKFEAPAEVPDSADLDPGGVEPCASIETPIEPIQRDEVRLTLNLANEPEPTGTKSDCDSLGTPMSSATNTEPGQGADELERELECEPAFERRDVHLKCDRDPRLDYELGEELGRGKFGTVYRCTERTSGRRLAAKFVHMRRREDRIDVEREISIMSALQHKRLLQLYDAYDDGKSEMCLITELVEGGELFERIVDDDFQLTERKAAIFMRQICEGVEYMHEQRIVHLDMKPENILCVSRTGNRIKLIDFGLARKLDADEPLRVMFGTPDFAAPEVLSYDIVSLATDMWSVGVICYVLLSGMSPFMGDNDMETMANVTRATYDFDDEAFEPISDLAKDFIAKLLVRDQSERLTPSQCLKHPWLTKRMAASRRSSLVAGNAASQSKGAESSLVTVSEDSGELEHELELGQLEDEPSLSKRNLKKYVIRRKWHKTVHAIMALGRMGANLKLKA